MKYYEMHNHVYEKLAENGKVSWDGVTDPSELFNHDINLSLSKRIDKYFPTKSGKSVIDLGCGTGTASLYLARLGFEVYGVDISQKAIEIANENKKNLGLSAKFEVHDLTTLKKTSSDLVVDSSLLHCLVDDRDRKKFYNLCSNMAFIHTMIESDDMSSILDKEHFTLKDTILWSKGPEDWDMDWHTINGQKVFKHRKILSKESIFSEIKENGFEILEFDITPQEKNPSILTSWIKKISS